MKEESKLEIEEKSILIKDATKFHFFNKFCIKAFLPKNKKNFFSFAASIIDEKLSMENILKMSIKNQIMRNLLLNEEQSKLLNSPHIFNLEDHLAHNYKLSNYQLHEKNQVN